MTSERVPPANRPIIASDAAVPLQDAAFLRSVLEAIPSFVVRLDPELRISYINHLRGGVTLDQVIGRPAHELIAPEDRENFTDAVERALRTGEVCSYRARGSRPVTERGFAHYESYAVPIDHGDGRRAICVVATDVSELVARAEALQRSEEKLRVAVDATGVGLWTWDVATNRVEWDAREHGGFIAFESSEGRGTTASVYLPLAPAVAASAPEREAPQARTRADRGTILIVDDEQAIRHLVGLLLRERGHEVHVAEDGASAAAALDAGLRPNVIVLDRSLPGWSPARTIEELRRRAGSAPILYFTGHRPPEDEQQQVQEVLYKPLRVDELAASVERWMAKRG